MWRIAAGALAFCLTGGACTNTIITATAVDLGLGGAGTGQLFEPEACGACVLGAPDVACSVPPDFSLITFHRLNSIDGGYYHKQGTCDCYVVDVWMFSNSNLVPYPNGFPSAVWVRGNGFDTPSSEQFGALIPTVQEDCQRYYRATRMWEKREGTDSWVEVGKRISFGSWAGGKCSIGAPAT